MSADDKVRDLMEELVQSVERAKAARLRAAEETCPRSQRVDGPKHSWHFDGDDPYVVCHWCGEVRDAISGACIASYSDRSPDPSPPTPV